MPTVALKQGYSSSIKKFYAEWQQCRQHGAKLSRCRDEKWFNTDPHGRSDIVTPQGDGVDGEGKPKGGTRLSSMLRHDEGYRRPSKNMAAASDTFSGQYIGATLSNSGLCG